MKAMSDAEKSIAVKRKIAVTRPMTLCDSPAEVYSPKRKKSDPARDEESPPPYFPSRKEASSRRSNRQHIDQRTLSRNDARHTLSRDDRRELISRSRREELLRTIGIDRSTTSHKSDTAKSQEKKREHVDKDATYERKVMSDRNVGEVKNFHITARVSPQSKKTVIVNESSIPAVEQRSSVTSRLGKVIVERKSSPEPGDEGEDIKPKTAQSKLRPAHRDARYEIKSKASNLKSEPTVSKKGSARVISRLGKEAVQKQCEAAVISVNSSRVVDKTKISASPDSRVVCCEESGSGDEEDEHTKDRDIKIRRESSTDGMHQKTEDEPEDLAEMIDDDLEPELLDSREEFTLDLEDEDDIINVVGDLDAEEMVAPEKVDEGKRGTRFIVTLDGIDERQFDPADAALYEKLGQPMSELAPDSLPLQAFEQNEKLYLDLLAQTRPLPQSPLQQTIHPLTRGILAANKLQPPKIQPFSINLKDSDDEHEDKEMKPLTVKGTSYDQPMETGEEELEISAVKRAKMTERCKFWPACAAGSACEYHHPTTHCKTFPNCKFGDKCLFIHPNCRFDSKCTRPDCPFTHTSRRTSIANTHVIAIPQPRVIFTPAPLPSHYTSYGAPSFSSSQTTCRFYPNCYNVNCTFLHPKPCRFGVGCKSQGCPFYHPPLPGKSKLKWQAQLDPHKTSLPDTTKVESAAPKFSPSNSTAVSSTSQ